MPPFPRDVTSPQPDWDLLRFGVVTLYWREDLFDDAMRDLRELGYKLIEIDTLAALDHRSLLATIGKSLDFPDYYGVNLDALHECLLDVAWFQYGADAESAGTVIAFRHYDSFRSHSSAAAESILDILAAVARDALLIGHRMIVLVQSDDPDISFGPLGAQSARWNQREWFTAARHPDQSTSG